MNYIRFKNVNWLTIKCIFSLTDESNHLIEEKPKIYSEFWIKYELRKFLIYYDILISFKSSDSSKRILIIYFLSNKRSFRQKTIEKYTKKEIVVGIAVALIIVNLCRSKFRRNLKIFE